jgi:hypothetical protein
MLCETFGQAANKTGCEKVGLKDQLDLVSSLLK